MQCIQIKLNYYILHKLIWRFFFLFVHKEKLNFFHNKFGFSLDTPVSYTNKTDLHDKTKVLLKVMINIITPPFS
jgi:hypothetical protein